MKYRFLKGIALGLAVMMTFTACKSGNDSTKEVQNQTAEEEKTDAADATEDEQKEEALEETETVTEEKAEENADIPILRDTYEKVMGGRIGCAATQSELEDEKVFEIITTHFNALTFGNELKPDALFNYSNDRCPGTKEEELNGEIITVPYMNYSRAESMLDKIYDYNEANPDKKVMIRGHVLVWHSQTPEWFFHVDYDKSKDYVDKDTMNKRLEWYIKTVLTHFTGEDSKYKDMFYGWDVVNEAISDGSGKIRTDNENASEPLSNSTHGSNSSWYHVYESDEFIINAFKYANKYAPESLELYYNDYNECNIQKRNGIIELLEKIKANEGAPGEGTRITAMGMQGHYDISNPDFNSVEATIKAYAKVVGNVQITEMDINNASKDYDGSEEARKEDEEKLRKRYNMLYFAIKSANNNDDVNFTGLTFWGTVDHYSWLQSRSNVGGANKTGLACRPLLFNENYEPKECFYVFANE